MTSPEQPRESDLEHLVSLTGRDVQAIDAAVLAEVTPTWVEASVVVKSSHAALLSSYPLVPDVFFSYRLRKLVGAGVIESTGTVDRQLNYQVRTIGHAPAA